VATYLIERLSRAERIIVIGVAEYDREKEIIVIYIFGVSWMY
jgi:hypothetical protein